mmetsp:Transcript_79489/g.92928  ORF Transcript_79489/g.92928 Transcript_79489/m.92928 type:complete len:297 (+) Transcript_79489:41-931(+)
MTTEMNEAEIMNKLISGDGGLTNIEENEADIAAEGDGDDDEYEGMSKKEICFAEKSKGTEKFKVNDYTQASKHYTKALMAFKYATEEIAEEGQEGLEKAVKEIQIPCHLNLALCFLKLNEYDMAKIHANHVLDIDPDNVKALYRKALVNYHTGYLTDAKNDLKLANELDPTNQEVITLMHMVRDKRKAENEREKKINQKIINNLEFKVPEPTTTTNTTKSEQLAQEQEIKSNKEEEKNLKSKKIEGSDDFSELNKMERKMTMVVFEKIKYVVTLPFVLTKNICCRRKNAPEKKKTN